MQKHHKKIEQILIVVISVFILSAGFLLAAPTANVLRTLIPEVTNTYDLGSASAVWRKLFVTDVQIDGNATTTGGIYVGTSIQFPAIAAPDYEPGLLFYEQYGALDGLSFYDAEVDTTLNIGKEQWKDVRNCNSGSTILNGTAVYLTGTVISQVPCVLPASATTELNATVVGVTTHDIETNTNGVITTFGVLNGLNTNGLSEGAILYLATTTDGDLNTYRNMTTTKPDAPYYKVRIGEIDYAHPTLGKIEIKPEFPHSLNENSDIQITSATTNDLLSYNGSYWANTDEIIVTNATTTNTLEAGDVYIPSMDGNTTYRSVNDWFKLMNSAGRLTGGAVTDAGSGNIDVAAGTGILRIADDDVSQVKFIDWTASTTIDTLLNGITYVGVDYNGGSPKVVTMNTENWDLDTNFPLAKVINENDTVHILNNPWWVGDGLTNVIERFQSFGSIYRDERVGGLSLSVTGTRSVAVSAGQLWSRLTEFPVSAFDSNATGTFETYWRSAADTWTSADVSQYPITQYNRLSDNTLQTINNNYYANWWVYVEADNSEIALVYPQAEYPTSAGAEAATPPTNIPTHIREHGILIGRIIFRQGNDTPIEVQSAFTQTFTASLAADHGNLTGLTDDDHSQYALLAGTRGAQTFAGGISMNSATTTDSLYVGGKLTVLGSTNVVDITQQNTTVNGTLSVTGQTLLATATGNVGIGTTTPLALFEVVAPSNTAQIARFDGNYNGQGGYITIFDKANYTTRGYIGYGQTLFSSPAVADSVFGIRSQGDMAFGDAGAVNMYINTAGNVGIGTTGPNHTLQIGNMTTSNVPFGVLADSDGQNINLEENSGGESWQLGINSAGDLSFLDSGSLSASVMFQDGGNVGIGTTGPSQKLHIYGDEVIGKIESYLDTKPAALYLSGNQTGQDGQVGSIIGFNQADSLGYMYFLREDADNSGEISFGTQNAGTIGERMRIDKTGNVGIGTTGPARLLHVNGGSDPTIQITDSDSGSTLSDGVRFQQSNADTYLINQETGDMYLGVNNSNDVTILDGGNVGIGTTNPVAKLEVIGASRFSGDMTFTDPSNQNIYGPYGTVSNTAYSFNNDADTGIYRPDADIMSLVTGGTDRIYINATGNVGIGTTNPIYKLDVVGNTRITGSATTTATVDAAQFCISGTDCITSWAAGSTPWTDAGTWLTPSDGEGLIVNASSTIIGDFRVDGNATTTASFDAAQFLVNNTPLGDIYSPIAGSASITTLGTIGTGVWESTAINPTYLDSSVIISTEIDTFSELNTLVADKTLVSEEDAATLDSLWTFNAGAVASSATTTDSFYSDGNRNRAEIVKSFWIASSTIDAAFIEYRNATTTFNLMNEAYPITVESVYCKTDTGTSGVECGDGTNMMAYLACTTSGASLTPASNNTFTAREDFECQLDNNGSTSNRTTVTIEYSYD